jgi:hypothetical protein
MNQAIHGALLDELEKLARKNTWEQGGAADRAFAAGVGGAAAAHYGQRPVGAIQEALIQGMDKEKVHLSSKDMARLYKKMGLKGTGVKFEDQARIGQAHFRPGAKDNPAHMTEALRKGGLEYKRGVVGVPLERGAAKSIYNKAHTRSMGLKYPRIGSNRGYTVAHELGHAKNYYKTRFGKGRMRLGLKTFGPATGANRSKGAILMAGLAGLAPGDSKAADYGSVGLATAAVAPLLYEEGKASVQGYKGLKSLGTLSPAKLKASRKALMKAFGTYGAAGALTIGSVAAARGLRKLLDRGSK